MVGNKRETGGNKSQTAFHTYRGLGSGSDDKASDPHSYEINLFLYDKLLGRITNGYVIHAVSNVRYINPSVRDNAM